MGEDVFVCENCGTKLQEINGRMQCYICGEERENLTQLQILTHIERAKKWVYYGAFDEAKKELKILEQHQIGGSVVYMLYLMMDMQVATQEELKLISKNYQENVYFQKIMKCSAENTNDFLGGTIAGYSQDAAKNKEEKDEKAKKQAKIATYAGAVFLTFAMDSAVAPYQVEAGFYQKFWSVWILTLGVFFGRKKIPEKYRRYVYIGLGIIWVCFFTLWSNVIAKYGA